MPRAVIGGPWFPRLPINRRGWQRIQTDGSSVPLGGWPNTRRPPRGGLPVSGGAHARASSLVRTVPFSQPPSAPQGVVSRSD
jgi:hypothetical protein